MQGSSPLGLHRVVKPAGALPQAAEILDADPAKRWPDEVHLRVETLNIDSASMRQLDEEAGGDPARVGRRIQDIVAARGKMQNPVTGSGGMLLGRVAWIGAEVGDRFGVAVGDRVATLVSLTLTPLSLERIVAVRLATHQVDVEGTAIVFASGMMARMPDDLPERLALGVYDVAGAAPQILRLAQPGQSVLILGAGGKSGLLAAAAARRQVGEGGVVIGAERDPGAARAARELGHCRDVVEVDAADPVATAEAVLAFAPAGYDLTVSCVNVPGAEMSAILATRERGTIYFFSMATSFQRAALGAEGVSKDVDMLIGNGYCSRHADQTLAILRREPALLAELAKRFP